jgi:hypothetical protein
LRRLAALRAMSRCLTVIRLLSIDFRRLSFDFWRICSVSYRMNYSFGTVPFDLNTATATIISSRLPWTFTMGVMSIEFG